MNEPRAELDLLLAAHRNRYLAHCNSDCDHDCLLRFESQVLSGAATPTDPAPARTPAYQIALRHDDLGLDDVVVRDVRMFRMERMDDDHVWLACYLTDGQDIVFDLWCKSKQVLYAARKPLPHVVYEHHVRVGDGEPDA